MHKYSYRCLDWLPDELPGKATGDCRFTPGVARTRLGGRTPAPERGMLDSDEINHDEILPQSRSWTNLVQRETSSWRSSTIFRIRNMRTRNENCVHRSRWCLNESPP